MEKRFNLLFGFAIAFLIVIIFLLGSTPPVDRDALTHHLAVPKLYLKNGGIYEIPHIAFSYYPMNLDLLYLIPLYFGNDIIPKYIHFSFGLLTALLIFTYLKKRISGIYGTFGALFFLSLPVIVKLSTTVYVDLGLIFFSTAAIIFMLAWLDNKTKLRYLLLSGIFCGLCLGTKYNGMITFFLLSSFVPLCYIRLQRSNALNAPLPALKNWSSKIDTKQETFRAIAYGVVFAVVALVIFSPWMIRNYIWAKNPIHPLYGSFFSPEKDSPSLIDEDLNTGSAANEPADHNQSMNHFVIRRNVYQESLWQTLLIPVRIFFEGQDDTPKFFDGRLNPFLFFLPMAAFIPSRSATSRLKREQRILLSFSILYLLFAFFKTDMRIRYVSPIIPPLVILSVYGLQNLVAICNGIRSTITRRLYATAGLLGISLLFFLNSTYIADQYRLMRPLDYVLGKIDRDSYIQQCRSEYAVFQYANRNLPDNSRILGLYLGNRSYYCDRELFFGDELLLKTLQHTKSPEEVLTRIKKGGFTHIVINLYKFMAWYGKDLTSLEQDRLLRFFRDNANLLLSHDGYQLFRI